MRPINTSSNLPNPYSDLARYTQVIHAKLAFKENQESPEAIPESILRDK